MSDDIKERLLNESYKGQEAMRREALARIEALEAQLAAAREALEPFAKLADHTKYSHRDSRPMIYAFDTCLGQAITVGHLRKARAALASLPAPAAAPSDIERAFQDACDEAGCDYDNEALLMAIHALKSAAAPTREEIAKIIDPDAKFEDIEGVQWSKFELQRRELAYLKANAILALKSAPAK